MINMAADVQCKNSNYECERILLFIPQVCWALEPGGRFYCTKYKGNLGEDRVRKGEGEVPRSGP